jgi:hypothetical protein
MFNQQTTEEQVNHIIPGMLEAITGDERYDYNPKGD